VHGGPRALLAHHLLHLVQLPRAVFDLADAIEASHDTTGLFRRLLVQECGVALSFLLALQAKALLLLPDLPRRGASWQVSSFADGVAGVLRAGSQMSKGGGDGISTNLLSRIFLIPR
jgi:hypothetical protein